MNKTNFKIQTNSVYVLIALFWLCISIGGLIHYLRYEYTGSLIFTILIFLFTLFITLTVTISISDDYLIVKKAILFKAFSLSVVSIKISEITAIHYEGQRGRGIILPHRVFKIFRLNKPIEFTSGFDKKDMKKFADKLIEINPKIEKL